MCAPASMRTDSPTTRMNDTRGSFTPAAGAIEIRFVDGDDGLVPIPVVLSQPRLSQRFAVVQATYVKGWVDMYFDEVLWRTLPDFVVMRGDQATMISYSSGMTEEPLGRFLMIGG